MVVWPGARRVSNFVIRAQQRLDELVIAVSRGVHEFGAVDPFHESFRTT
mgnify:CR=1 FL=1